MPATQQRIWKEQRMCQNQNLSLTRNSSACTGNMNSIRLHEPNARSQKRSLRVRYSRFYILQWMENPLIKRAWVNYWLGRAIQKLTQFLSLICETSSLIVWMIPSRLPTSAHPSMFFVPIGWNWNQNWSSVEIKLAYPALFKFLGYQR